MKIYVLICLALWTIAMVSQIPKKWKPKEFVSWFIGFQFAAGGTICHWLSM